MFSPREAMQAARKLGWEVEAKRKSGALTFRAPDGETYTCSAPGRADRVPMRLAKALTEAQQ